MFISDRSLFGRVEEAKITTGNHSHPLAASYLFNSAIFFVLPVILLLECICLAQIDPRIVISNHVDMVDLSGWVSADHPLPDYAVSKAVLPVDINHTIAMFFVNRAGNRSSVFGIP